MDILLVHPGNENWRWIELVDGAETPVRRRSSLVMDGGDARIRDPIRAE